MTSPRKVVFTCRFDDAVDERIKEIAELKSLFEAVPKSVHDHLLRELPGGSEGSLDLEEGHRSVADADDAGSVATLLSL